MIVITRTRSIIILLTYTIKIWWHNGIILWYHSGYIMSKNIWTWTYTFHCPAFICPIIMSEHMTVFLSFATLLTFPSIYICIYIRIIYFCRTIFPSSIPIIIIWHWIKSTMMPRIPVAIYPIFFFSRFQIINGASISRLTCSSIFFFLSHYITVIITTNCLITIVYASLINPALMPARAMTIYARLFFATFTSGIM